MKKPIKLALGISFDNVGAVSFNDMLKALLNAHRDAIVVWLAKRNNVNAYTYEGGIDSWWGWGSVMMCELGICVAIEVTDKDTITVTLG